MSARKWCVVWSLGLGAFACGDDAGGSKETAVGPGRGSNACQDWQDAVCQKADDCDASEALCLESYRSFECISDAKAQQCAAAWQQLDGCEPPTGCLVADVVDPMPAQQRCQDFIEVVCSTGFRCDKTPEADCLASAESELSCELAVGISLDYEACLDTLKGACVAEFPNTCEGIVLLLAE